jgi:hypothetical protein
LEVQIIIQFRWIVAVISKIVFKNFVNSKMFFSRDKMEGVYNSVVSSMKSSDIGITWIFHEKNLGVFNMEELVAQQNVWVTCGKNLRCEDYNNKTYTQEGKVWYSLTLQECDENNNFIQTDDKNPHDPFTLLVFGTMVNGYNYFFLSKEIRDYVADFVNKKKPMKYTTVASGGMSSVMSSFEALENKRPIDAMFKFMDCHINIKFKDKKELRKALNRMKDQSKEVPYHIAFERLFDVCKRMRAGELNIENDVHFATCMCVLFEVGKLKQDQKTHIIFEYRSKDKCCSVCPNASKLRCQNCNTKYCSVECQGKDWECHKHTCDHSRKPV